MRKPKSSRRLEVERETSHLVGFLETVVSLAGRSQRDIDRELGHPMGTAHRLFSGKSEGKVRDLMEILALLEVSPRTFFLSAYQVGASPQEEAKDKHLEEVLGRLQRAGDDPEAPIVRQLEEVVDRVLEDRRRRRRKASPAPVTGSSGQRGKA
jgi:hypothetical protein